MPQVRWEGPRRSRERRHRVQGHGLWPPCQAAAAAVDAAQHSVQRRLSTHVMGGSAGQAVERPGFGLNKRQMSSTSVRHTQISTGTMPGRQAKAPCCSNLQGTFPAYVRARRDALLGRGGGGGAWGGGGLRPAPPREVATCWCCCCSPAPIPRPRPPPGRLRVLLQVLLPPTTTTVRGLGGLCAVVCAAAAPAGAHRLHQLAVVLGAHVLLERAALARPEAQAQAEAAGRAAAAGQSGRPGGREGGTEGGWEPDR